MNAAVKIAFNCLFLLKRLQKLVVRILTILSESQQFQDEKHCEVRRLILRFRVRGNLTRHVLIAVKRINRDQCASLREQLPITRVP